MSEYLPWDIIVEILSRLPVKSLMRFKCVSKPLNRMISQDADFKKKHLDQSNFEKAIVCYNGRFSSVLLCHLSYLALDNEIDNEGVDAIDVPGHFRGDVYGERTISNSCDGLFCVLGEPTGLVIWNPHTRESKNIPDCPVDYRGELSCTVMYGLAYDSISDDYKVIGVTRVHGIVDSHQFSIYSLKTGSPWRNIKDDFPCKYFSHKDNNTVVNGAFHWIAHDKRDSPFVLITLDVANEKFDKCALPSLLACRDENSPNRRPVLCVLREKLCIFDWSNIGFDLWMMEEYGVVQSLRKILSITDSASIFFWGRFCYCKPMYWFEDGSIIMYDFNGRSEQVSIYKDGKLVNKEIIARFRVVSSYICKETIISPHMYEQQ